MNCVFHNARLDTIIQALSLRSFITKATTRYAVVWIFMRECYLIVLVNWKFRLKSDESLILSKCKKKKSVTLSRKRTDFYLFLRLCLSSVVKKSHGGYFPRYIVVIILKTDVGSFRQLTVWHLLIPG